MQQFGFEKSRVVTVQPLGEGHSAMDTDSCRWHGVARVVCGIAMWRAAFCVFERVFGNWGEDLSIAMRCGEIRDRQS